MFRLQVDSSLDLVLLETRHAGMLYALVDQNRAHLREYLPWVDATRSIADSQTWIQGALEQFARSQSLNVGLWTHGALAGVAGYHTVDWPNRRTSLGYWLAESHQGRGLMTRAVRALSDHALVSLGINRIEVRAAMDNRRSRAVAERLGYQFEGTCRQAEWLYDHFVDHAIYAMLRSDWRDNTAR